MTHRDGALGMLPAPCTDVCGIVLALLGTGDPAEDGAACSVREMKHDTCSDY